MQFDNGGPIYDDGDLIVKHVMEVIPDESWHISGRYCDCKPEVYWLDEETEWVDHNDRSHAA